jgi:phage baseplate assembly protein W
MLNGFGVDITALPDLAFQTITGPENLVQAIARRLVTPRGGLFYDDQYGFDVRAYLNETLTDDVRFSLETLCAAECEKDERVESAEVTLQTVNLNSLRLEVSLETTGGPVRFILPVNAVSAEVLRG